MSYMPDMKSLQKINTNLLDKIQEVYVSNIDEIKQYYPQSIKKKFDGCLSIFQRKG